MRVVAYNNLKGYWALHPEAKPSLKRWHAILRAGRWGTMQDVLVEFGSAKSLNDVRCRFAIHGGNYRLIGAFDFRRQIVYIKFLGTHAEYDKIDALTISQF